MALTPRALTLLVIALIGFTAAQASASEVARKIQLFPLSAVRLSAGPFKTTQDVDFKYLLALDVDRFMAPYRTEAGLTPKAPKYPNWESSGLDGHMAGHYLTALAQMAVITGDAEMVRRLNYMVDEMAECQRSNGDGYVGGTPHGRELWIEVAAGKLKVDNFSINGKWVPWYNLHKTFAGLRDAWLIAGNTQARDILITFADWCDTLVANLTDEQIQTMLSCEQGGMNEVLADVSAITGDAKYLALAKRFSHQATLAPLLKHEDKLTGLHANTQIPKVIGYARIAELGGDPAWNDAAEYFWKAVVTNRSVAFGGNSAGEHFNPSEDFSSMLETREGPETCNTYNMLRLSEQLYRRDPDPRYPAYFERTLFNHILSSQHPVHGGFVYFTPIRPQHYRNYSQPTECFWCCVGTGIENHCKYGKLIYAHTDDALVVNLFIASELTWAERGLKLRQETAFPDEERTRLLVSLKQPQKITLRLRTPSWIKTGGFAVRLNGEPAKHTAATNGYVSIEREWRDGDSVEIDLPMTTMIEPLPDKSGYVAVLHGPILLAAKTPTEPLTDLIANNSRMGHRTEGALLPLDRAPMLVGNASQLAEQIVPVKGKAMTFTATELIQPATAKNLELIPFFRVHDSRTMIYWRSVTTEKYTALVAEIEAQEKTRIALDARTLDQLNPGEQQPEVEHDYRGEGSANGVNLGRHWRDSDQCFGYNLKGQPNTGGELVITYLAAEKNREFNLVVNEQIVATVALKGGKPDSFVDVAYPIPDTMVGANGLLRIEFLANAGSRTGSIYGIRLLRKAQ